MKRHPITLALAIILTAVSCQEKHDPDYMDLSKEEREERKTVNYFGYQVMGSYYLWNEEIKSALESWNWYDDPVEKVRRIRYKDSEYKDIDKWTVMTDDIDSMVGSTLGVSTTYGMDFKLYYTDASNTTVCLVTTVVYPDSPAAKAGIKRGDIFVRINGKELNKDNCSDIIYDDFLYAPGTSLEDRQGNTIRLQAVEMYEDPVLVDKVLDIDGHKVGYLFYNKFTLRSISSLAEVGRRFRAEGIESLILDMRYNPGGYVTTETALGSMLAPESAVSAGSVFQTTVYNSILNEAWGKDETRFVTSISYEDAGRQVTVDLSDANFGVSKIYAILTEDSASASEAVLVGLMPYMDVTVIGKQSYGKYCSGIMLGAKDWFKDNDEYLDQEYRDLGKKYAKKWGIYVMIGRYADCNGNTPCMPDGFVPDLETFDHPDLPGDLGDPREAMLAHTIAWIKNEPASKAPALPADSMLPVPDQPRDPMFGAHIMLPGDLGLLH